MSEVFLSRVSTELVCLKQDWLFHWSRVSYKPWLGPSRVLQTAGAKNTNTLVDPARLTHLGRYHKEVKSHFPWSDDENIFQLVGPSTPWHTLLETSNVFGILLLLLVFLESCRMRSISLQPVAHILLFFTTKDTYSCICSSTTPTLYHILDKQSFREHVFALFFEPLPRQKKISLYFLHHSEGKWRLPLSEDWQVLTSIKKKLLQYKYLSYLSQ